MSEWVAEKVAWEKIARAARLIVEGAAERIEGDGWQVYRHRAIIRIDLSSTFNPTKP